MDANKKMEAAEQIKSSIKHLYVARAKKGITRAEISECANSTCSIAYQFCTELCGHEPPETPSGLVRMHENSGKLGRLRRQWESAAMCYVFENMRDMAFGCVNRMCITDDMGEVIQMYNGLVYEAYAMFHAALYMLGMEGGEEP